MVDEPEAQPDAGPAGSNLRGSPGREASPPAGDPGHDTAVSPGGSASLRIGATVTGKVAAVHRDEALIDAGAKVDGELPLVAAAAESADVSPGQALTATVAGLDAETGAPRPSRSHVADAETWNRIEEAQRDAAPIEGLVREQVKGGLVLDVGVRAFMPASQVERGYVADLSPYVGQTLRARVLEFDRARGKVILSRRALLDEEARQRREQVWAQLEEGQIREGLVKGLTDFGAFIDLGGVDGLLHVSAMSWERVERPGDLLKIGDTLRVRVLRLDREKQKISLGLKQVEPDPWSVVAERYPVGATVEGRVMRLCSFGAFVQIQPGVDGLIHISQLSEQRVREPGEVVHEGDVVRATVLRVSPADRRISLSLRSAPTAPQRSVREGGAAPAPRSAETVTVGDMVGEVGALLQQEFRHREADADAGKASGA